VCVCVWGCGGVWGWVGVCGWVGVFTSLCKGTVSFRGAGGKSCPAAFASHSPAHALSPDAMNHVLPVSGHPIAIHVPVCRTVGCIFCEDLCADKKSIGRPNCGTQFMVATERHGKYATRPTPSCPPHLHGTPLHSRHVNPKISPVVRILPAPWGLVGGNWWLPLSHRVVGAPEPPSVTSVSAQETTSLICDHGGEVPPRGGQWARVQNGAGRGCRARRCSNTPRTAMGPAGQTAGEAGPAAGNVRPATACIRQDKTRQGKAKRAWTRGFGKGGPWQASCFFVHAQDTVQRV
jgi:hypothetical protein